MLDRINIPLVSKDTKLFGLIGYPLSHSFSKQYFEAKFEREGLKDYQFENFPIRSISELSDILQQYNSLLKGIAVTIPYKQQVLDYIDSTTAIPAELAACNCIKISDGKLLGYNTDWIGFEKSFTPILQTYHKKALVLGTGGAAKAVCYVLKRLNISYTLVSRKNQNDHSVSYNDLTERIIKEHTIIINTTPKGMYPDIDEYPLIPYENITSAHYLYDLVYNPIKSRFLKKGEERGAVIKNGADMLLLQAEENWKIWNS